MAKYEEFEDWMVGRRVVHNSFPNDEGVVIRVDDLSRDYVIVDYQKRGGSISIISNLTFLETQDCEPESVPIPWEVEQEVWCLLRGKGVVNSVGTESVVIWFDSHGAYKYTSKGEHCGYEGVRSLFFSEPKITAETMPPKKPFVPKLKEGDKVLIKDKQGLFGEGTVRVVHKECDDRVYISEAGDYFMKYDIASLQVIGEEIKF